MTTQSTISPELYRAGTGEPLVLLHGLTDTWRTWRPIFGDLVPYFDVIAPTLHGHSDGPELLASDDPRSFSDMADLAEESFDALGLDTFHVAGNSLGGGLALELARRGRARSVVGLAPAGGLDRGNRTEALRILKQFKRMQAMTRSNQRMLPWVFRSPVRRRLALLDAMQRGDQMLPTDAVEMARRSLDCTVVLDDVFAVLSHGEPWMEGLDQISVPTLVVWGEKDRILPIDRHTERLRREIPGVEFRSLPGIGHVPMHDDPRLIGSMIRKFALAAESARAAA
jgi:pimeloyl-ACP methyl ester carboxylesterase